MMDEEEWTGSFAVLRGPENSQAEDHDRAEGKNEVDHQSSRLVVPYMVSPDSVEGGNRTAPGQTTGR